MATIRRIFGLDHAKKGPSAEQLRIRDYVQNRNAELDRLKLELLLVSGPPRVRGGDDHGLPFE
jgi:hypothetical protein